MRCKKCKAQLGYLKILKSFWLSYGEIECNSCGAKHSHKFLNRVIGGTIILATILFVKLGPLPEFSMATEILIYFMIITLLSLFLPLVLKFELKDSNQ